MKGKITTLRTPRLNINLIKVIAGVLFSLIWAKVLYTIWKQPDYLTFVWFYLIIGSVILKWILFWIIDRVYLHFRLRALKMELDESLKKVEKLSMIKRNSHNK